LCLLGDEIDKDGKRDFFEKNKNDVVTIMLEEMANSCPWRFWKAFHLQRSHLLLLQQGFRLDLCSPRWFQLTGLGTSVERDNFHQSHVANVNLGFEDGEEI
jgi:hypothetical protein